MQIEHNRNLHGGIETMKHPLKNIIALQKKDIPAGICSICSSNKLVIDAAMKSAMERNTDVLIEATANQVNQDGGYSGMTPKDFVEYVGVIADSVGFPTDKIILLPCSGGSNCGQITNQVAVNLDVLGIGRIYCLAGIGAHIDGMVESAKGAKRVVALDGCQVRTNGFSPESAPAISGGTGFFPFHNPPRT